MTHSPRAMTHAYMCHDFPIHSPQLIHTCTMPHPYVHHASFVHAPCLIRTCAKPHAYVCHDLFVQEKREETRKRSSRIESFQQHLALLKKQCVARVSVRVCVAACVAAQKTALCLGACGACVCVCLHDTIWYCVLLCNTAYACTCVRV